MTFRHILAIVGQEMQRTPALQRAIEIASRTGAELHLRMFGHHPGIAAVGLVRPEVMRLAQHAYVTQRERWLADGAAELRSLGIRADVRFTWGGALEERVTDEVLLLEPDLVVKDVGLDHAGRHVHLDSHEHRLARLCPAPLLLVQPMSQAGPRRVIAAVDPGARATPTEALAAIVVRSAATLASGFRDASVHLVHAFPGPAFLGWAEDGPPDGRVFESLAMLRQEHVRRFGEFAQGQDIPPGQRHFVEGAPAAAIATLACDPCKDVIAVGNISRSGLARFMFGSTTDALLSMACCDVLVVKPEGFRAALLARRAALAEAA